MKKNCNNCDQQYNASGNQKFCAAKCRNEFRIKNTKMEELKTTRHIYPETLSEYAGVAWLRLYRIDKSLVNNNKLKLIMKVTPDGKIAITESLSRSIIGNGHLFPDRIPPEQEDTWACVVYLKQILSGFISEEGTIKLALLFQYYDNGTDKVKITQMVPKEVVALNNTNIGHGNSRTKQIVNVKDWIDGLK